MLRALSPVREAEGCKGEGRDGGLQGGRAGRESREDFLCFYQHQRNPGR